MLCCTRSCNSFSEGSDRHTGQINKQFRPRKRRMEVPVLFPSLEDIEFHGFCLIWDETKLRHKLRCVFRELTLPQLRCVVYKREENRRD